MSVATAFGRGVSYYSTHPTATCPDCGQPCDGSFGDHGGDCLEHIHSVSPRTALGIIRRHALRQPGFSSEDCRADMDQAGIPGASRGPAFGAAKRRGWIETDGYLPSTKDGTNRHPVASYSSCIYVEKREKSA